MQGLIGDGDYHGVIGAFVFFYLSYFENLDAECLWMLASGAVTVTGVCLLSWVSYEILK